MSTMSDSQPIMAARPEPGSCAMRWCTRFGLENQIPDKRGPFLANNCRLLWQEKRGDIIYVIPEADVEQILIRKLPAGTKAALAARARRHGRSSEAEARAVIAESLAEESTSMVDLIQMEDGPTIDFEPEPLGLTVRTGKI